MAIGKARKKKKAPGETLPARREDKMEVLVEEPDKEPDKCIYCYEQLCGWVTTEEDVIFFLMRVNMCTYRKRICHPIKFETKSCDIR